MTLRNNPAPPISRKEIEVADDGGAAKLTHGQQDAGMPSFGNTTNAFARTDTSDNNLQRASDDDADSADDAYTIDVSDLLTAENFSFDEPEDDAQNSNANISDDAAHEKHQQAAATHAARDTDNNRAAIELIATRAELRRVEHELLRGTGELLKSQEAARRANQEHTALMNSHERLQSDFDNFRKRSEREREEWRKSLVGEIVSRLLPVLDNFCRATQTHASFRDEETRQFAVGVELIGKQLEEVLASYGVEAIPAVGERFDPHVHEAIAAEATDEHPPNTVIEEIMRGYRLGDKLLRPSLVRVAAAP